MKNFDFGCRKMISLGFVVKFRVQLPECCGCLLLLISWNHFDEISPAKKKDRSKANLSMKSVYRSFQQNWKR